MLIIDFFTNFVSGSSCFGGRNDFTHAQLLVPKLTFLAVLLFKGSLGSFGQQA
jgi:hypothetical protein